MSQVPYDPSQPGYALQPAPSNGLGLAGFIVSLVGLILTCGVLSPVGLILSFIALFKQPRGFAIAGLVIGAAGSILLAAMIFGSVFGLAQFGGVGSVVTTTMAVGTATQRIAAYEREHHDLPDDEEGQKLIAGIPDGNGMDMRYKRLGPNQVELRSAGLDREFDTDDDLPMPVAIQHSR